MQDEFKKTDPIWIFIVVLFMLAAGAAAAIMTGILN
jgi:hypothetical protein